MNRHNLLLLLLAFVLPTGARANAVPTKAAADSAYAHERYADAARIYRQLVSELGESPQLYYNLGGYFGNVSASTESNYASCIIVAQNALKNYPYMKWREEFTALIMKSKFELAENSTEDKRLERYRDAEDECYGFINEFPDSKEVATAEKFIAKCKKVVKD